jgi:predicted homoserine dehydrogenase-like protein
MGLAERCTLKRDRPKDAVLTYDDVEVPPGRLCDRLRAEQTDHFG